MVLHIYIYICVHIIILCINLLTITINTLYYNYELKQDFIFKEHPHILFSVKYLHDPVYEIQMCKVLEYFNRKLELFYALISFPDNYRKHIFILFLLKYIEITRHIHRAEWIKLY